MKIYTRTGDTGETSLIGGVRVPKDDPAIAAFGSIDELNAALGLARSLDLPPPVDEPLDRIQHQLFDLGAQLAAGSSRRDLPAIDATHIAALEAAIDRFEAALPPLENFILPSGTPAACQLHVARSICRRAERMVVSISRQHPAPNGLALAYLNRLSDLLFVLARAANHQAGASEIKWQAGK